LNPYNCKIVSICLCHPELGSGSITSVPVILSEVEGSIHIILSS
jgi:hypothetical protein